MLELINSSEIRDYLYADLLGFARKGLRTLMYGCKLLPKEIAEQWCKDYQLASYNKNYDDMKSLESKLECNLAALCATAVED